MKRIIILIVLFCPCLLWAQVEKTEYFFDTDPGYGNGIDAGTAQVIENNPGKAWQSLTLNASVEGLDDGFHTLFIRTKNSYGWSATQSRPFVKTTLSGDEANEVERIEYFFDTDPGYGLGNTPEAASDNAQYVCNIDLDGLADGFHTLYIRAMNKHGRWSHVASRPVYKTILPAEASPNIIYAEYYIDADPGKGKGTEFAYTVSQESISFTADLLDLNNGEHTLYIRSKFRSGDWEKIGQHAFNVIGGDFIEDIGNEVKAYPNPVTNELFIKNDNRNIDAIEVVSANGQVLYKHNTGGQWIQLPFGAYQAGTYFLRLSIGEEIKTIKIIKQ